MNIFVIDECPIQSARSLPDRHITKMGIETCQMLSIVYSSWYFDWGVIPKKDGTPYATQRGAFRNHPCTKWITESQNNLIWTLLHGLEIVSEFEYRYNKPHGSFSGIKAAIELFCKVNNFDWNSALTEANKVKKFARAMPDELKYADCSDVEAYRSYIKTKEWVTDNYIKRPERKPIWMFD